MKGCFKGTYVCGLQYQACCAFNIELLYLLACLRPTTTTPAM